MPKLSTLGKPRVKVLLYLDKTLVYMLVTRLSPRALFTITLSLSVIRLIDLEHVQVIIIDSSLYYQNTMYN